MLHRGHEFEYNRQRRVVVLLALFLVAELVPVAQTFSEHYEAFAAEIFPQHGSAKTDQAQVRLTWSCRVSEMANFDLERIRIETGLGGLEHYAEIGSTNDRGLELVKRNEKAEIKLQFPFLILADRQTAGRGQFHRPWIAETGSLTCSLCTLTNHRQADALLPLAVGLAVCEAVEKIATNIQLKLKWPNDLLIGKRKLGGILTEQFSGKLVIGIGLNVNRDIDVDQIELHKDSAGVGCLSPNPLKSISLREAHGLAVNLTELTIEVVKQVKARIAEMESGRQEVLDSCHRRMIFREREIELWLPTGEKLVGLYRGLSHAGELLIDAQGKQHAVASALAITW